MRAPKSARGRSAPTTTPATSRACASARPTPTSSSSTTTSSSRISRFAEQFWMGFARELRADEGRFPIVPGTFAHKSRAGEVEATPLGDAYLALDGALQRMETTLDVLREKPPEVENLIRRIRETRFNLEFIVAGDDRHYVYW